MSNRTVISEEVCRRLRAAYADGQSVGQIADDFEYTSSAVRRHVHDYCSHSVADGRWGTSGEIQCPFCGASIRHLPDHLPNCSKTDEV